MVVLGGGEEEEEEDQESPAGAGEAVRGGETGGAQGMDVPAECPAR